jgi:hypothetical protein
MVILLVAGGETGVGGGTRESWGIQEKGWRAGIKRRGDRREKIVGETGERLESRKKERGR